MTLSPLFKLLSDETRLRVLVLLYQSDLCVCEICGILEEPQPKISKILSKLRDLNLVTDTRREKFVFYTLSLDETILTQTLSLILSNLDKYPYLQNDQIRLSKKENYATVFID